MKRLFYLIFSFTFFSTAFSGEIENACNAYVSILDSCDVNGYNCEELGKALESSLLKKDVNPETAEHFRRQCVKVCSLPDGKYREIREEIKKACIKSLKE
jgi:signal recognition particle GTPase